MVDINTSFHRVIRVLRSKKTRKVMMHVSSVACDVQVAKTSAIEALTAIHRNRAPSDQIVTPDGDDNHIIVFNDEPGTVYIRG